MYKLGFIGCGNMATAIIGGAVTSEFLKGDEICVFDVDTQKAEFLNKEYGVKTSATVEGLAENCEFVVLAVKPQVFPTVLPQIKDKLNNTTVVSRLIEGEYFRIEQMLSRDYETKVKINKKEFLSCIDRATLLVKEGDKKPNIIDINDEGMRLQINSQLGSMKEDIDIQKEGKDILIGFNPKFLIDALRVIDDENVTIYMVNPKAPCFIKDDEGKFIYLILPVNFNAASN